MAKSTAPLSRAQSLIEAVQLRTKLIRRFPDVVVWRPPCTVKVLIVTDGRLDFSFGDFGLSTFVHFLQNDGRFYVRFDITLAHLSGVVNNYLELTNPSDQSNEDLAAMENLLIDRSRITRHIKNFCFDNPDHFSPTMYNEIFLFGFENNYHNGYYPVRNNNRTRYPAGSLNVNELRAISGHMTAGGGVFATGDHGDIGIALCGSIKRVRNMRYWNHFPNSGDDSQVGMRNEWRNDTNQPGRDASMFGDQSDDIPQPLELKLYSAWVSYSLKARYPHPVLCSRFGRIDVFPDHPHEGQCAVPDSLTLTYSLDNSLEYPVEAGGFRPEPEIIAWGRVIAGTTSGGKDPAIAQRFGVVSAYDGHSVNQGRIICDSTWHHFVNVNLIGILEGGIFSGDLNLPGVDPAKHTGFLASTSGREALAKIAEYYINTAVWIAPPALHRCFLRSGFIVTAFWERVVESSVISPTVGIDKIDLKELIYIGIHARDVLGRAASQCQTLMWVCTWLLDIWPEIPDLINPWLPLSKHSREKPLLPTFDFMPIIDAALGAALLAMRQEMPYPYQKYSSKLQEKLDAAAIKGAKIGVARALDYFNDNLKTLKKLSDSFAEKPKKGKK